MTADVSKVNGWGDSDTTVFNLTITSTIQGDFQLQNGYGPKASQVMKVTLYMSIYIIYSI